MSTTPDQDLLRYAQTTSTLEASRSTLAELEQTEAVELFQKQLTLLKKRLLGDPRSLRSTFVADGVRAIAWEFQQEELGSGFTKSQRRYEHGPGRCRSSSSASSSRAIDDHLSWPSPAAMMAVEPPRAASPPE
jgi:hypothetical protein